MKMMTQKVREQILKVRDTGQTNMFDCNMVQVIADRMGFFDLVIYIEENKKEYVRFILTGNAPMEDEADDLSDINENDKKIILENSKRLKERGE